MMMTNNTKKTTQGRRKIEIKKIEQVNNRQVTFSKRRTGLFKKASELCILSGAEVAIIVASPGRHVFSFGHQSVDAVVDKYLSGSSSSQQPPKIFPPMHDFNKKYDEISNELEAEKKRSVMIDEAKSVSNGTGFWWDKAVVDEMGFEELEQFMAALEGLKKNLDIRIDELRMMKAYSTMPLTSMLAMNQTDNSLGLTDHVMNQTVYYGNAMDQTVDYGNAMVGHSFDFGGGGQF